MANILITGGLGFIGRNLAISLSKNSNNKVSIFDNSFRKNLTDLKIPKNIIQKNGAVSIQCCLSMVNNLNKISKSKVCVSVTGIAGPKGGTRQKPVGLVYIGIKFGKKVIINKCNFKNKGRIFIQKQTVKKTLNLLLKLIK